MCNPSSSIRSRRRRARAIQCACCTTPARLLGAVVLLSTVGWSKGESVCTFASPLGATFDLQDLVRHGDMPSYTVVDGDIPCTPEVEQNYTYAFNICNQVSGELPSVCKGLSGASALQIDKRPDADPGNACWRAGSFDATTAEEARVYFSLLDSSDPTKGVRLTYKGDHCRHNDQGDVDPNVVRTFLLEFECADVPVAVPVHALEFHHCEYTIKVPSVYGCPVECPVTNKHVCAGNGHCAYDTDKRAPRCFCNNGFTGADCAQTVTSTEALRHQNSAIIAVLVTLFVLVIVLGLATVIMFKQVKAYKDDATNYIYLAGGDADAEGI